MRDKLSGAIAFRKNGRFDPRANNFLATNPLNRLTRSFLNRTKHPDLSCPEGSAEMFSAIELKAQGYLQLMDPLWGRCLIIPNEEFTDEMALCLRVEGLRYHFTRLDNYGAVFVKLQKPPFTDLKASVPVLEVNC